ADGGDVRLDVLHGVVDGQQVGDGATRRVDVDGDVPVRVLALQVQQLGHDEVGDGVVDGRAQEDDAVLEQPGEDVEGAFPPARLLDHDGHEVGAGHWLLRVVLEPGVAARQGTEPK